MARLGELLPATPKSETGRGKKSPVAGTALFASHTIANYRKVAAHKAGIDEYYQRAAGRTGKKGANVVTPKGSDRPVSPRRT